MKKIIVLITVNFLIAYSYAEIKLPSLFSDGMVIQRNTTVSIWGLVNPNKEVKIIFDDQSHQTIANNDGFFSIKLSPMEASSQPRSILISSENELKKIEDVLVGEVWLCSGQSNMHWPVSKSDNYEQEKIDANYPQIRMFLTELNYSTEARNHVNGEWKITSPESVSEFSAVAYYFGRELHTELEVPIGLIRSSWGGTSIEAWSPINSLQDFPTVMENIENRKSRGINFDTNYVNKENNKALDQWKTIAAKARKEGKKPPKRPPWKHHPILSQHFPGNLYNAMIHPHTPYTIKGVIWYQGEANTSSNEPAKLYRYLLENLINSWRYAFKNNFSFYSVQLPNFQEASDLPIQDWGWPNIRQSFLDVHKEVQDAYMVVGIDAGQADDIHPTNKQIIGYRLAQQALVNDYGFDRVSGGPIYENMTIDGSNIIITFSDIGSGLVANDDQPLRRFAIAGDDQIFYHATAIIKNNEVIVSNSNVDNPIAVRYAWAMNPEACNLFNKEGFPASPFKTDDW